MRERPSISITGPISFKMTQPIAEGWAAAMTMLMMPPREVPITPTSDNERSVRKSITSSISMGTA